MSTQEQLRAAYDALVAAAEHDARKIAGLIKSEAEKELRVCKLEALLRAVNEHMYGGITPPLPEKLAMAIATALKPEEAQAETLADWRYEVASGDTLLGFEEWCQRQKDAGLWL